METPSKLKPALMGGVIFGLLSAIPFVNLGNCLCCAWVLLCGGLAAQIYIKDSYRPVKSGEGAMVGALAGVVCGVVVSIIGTVLSLAAPRLLIIPIISVLKQVVKDEALYNQLTEQMLRNSSAVPGIGQILLSIVINMVIYTGISTLGGVLGVALLEKRKEKPAPPSSYYPPSTPPYPPTGGN